VLNEEDGQAPLGQQLGVSVVICCHNSAKLLPNTLAHLKRQRISATLEWEIVVVDNGSTDGTESIARQCWGDDGPAPLRVVSEPRLGLSYARERAFEEAQYELVSFIDDDNWVAPGWVTAVNECMSADFELGAVGSINTAVADVPFPEWFSRYCHYYAAWAYRESATLAAWVLNGAGMTIRKAAWRELRRNGFQLRLTDRIGPKLTSCGDLEIGCAIQLGGWKIRVEPSLKLEHYMTPGRLQWRYLRDLLRGSGEAYVTLDCYLRISQSVQLTPMNRLRQCWWVRLSKEAMQLMCSYSVAKLVKSWFRDMDGDDEVAEIEVRIGRLIGLVHLRSSYGVLRRDIARAPWRKAELSI
jgi:cellulose synthase/poly-beta-1,6-N-acetylglucosamine synthase-like glycosyltransferase